MSDPIESPLRTEPRAAPQDPHRPVHRAPPRRGAGRDRARGRGAHARHAAHRARARASATPLPAATPFLVGAPIEGLRPGNQAPELAVTHDDGTAFQLQDLDGNPVRLEDLKGKLVWVNFWASWCPPCQGETPVLRDLDETYGDKGLEIVGVAVQETTVDNVEEYAERYQLGYRIAFDTSADIFRLYRVYALPTQFFIGPDGTILDVVNGPLSHQDAQARIDAWLPKD